MGSARKHDRARGKDKSNRTQALTQPTPSATKICGCPVPDPIRCFIDCGCYDNVVKGTPLPIGDDGVRMECSNDNCPFTDVLLHQRCFEAFEEHLLKVIGGLGSAKGWTPTMRRNNLWVQKGQSLIAKACRCRCGLGITKLDKLAADDRLKREKAEAQREAALAAGLPAPPLKKKRKSKNALPTLNFGVVKAAPKPLVEERESRTLSRCHSAKYRDVSTSSLSSTPTSYQAFESRRESFTYASDVWGLLPTFSSGNETQSVNSTHFADHDDTTTTSSRTDLTQEGSNAAELVSSPLPPRQTMSYASAMKDITSALNDCMVKTTPSLPLSSAEGEPFPDICSSSDCCFSTERLRKSSTIGDDDAPVGQWHLFNGRSFSLGESIIAHHFLPVWSRNVQ
ncbi:unnamed protein product [Haemonchus placei]|uniref:Headcase domain-containing protein n=1 Tax=Haemonchus placei TaxID=6290 RepID=A0A158QN92_HAEPC|nr:unnamed protein product [Haemonchus placei]